MIILDYSKDSKNNNTLKEIQECRKGFRIILQRREPIPKINRDLELESRYNICDSKYNKKGKQTSISDFVN